MPANSGGMSSCPNSGATLSSNSDGCGSKSTFEIQLELYRFQRLRLKHLCAASVKNGFMSHQPLIYLVDDHPDIRMVLADFLEMSSFDVASFATGSEVLQALETRLPDIAVIDIGLPDMSGNELAVAIRLRDQANAQRRVMLVAVTGRYQNVEILSNFDVYIQKPTEFKKICATIQNAYADRQSQLDAA